jgi:hypothetical protein
MKKCPSSFHVGYIIEWNPAMMGAPDLGAEVNRLDATVSAVTVARKSNPEFAS